MTIKSNLPDLPPETEGRDNATVVAFDAEARRRTSHLLRASASASHREAVCQHPMVKKAALKAALKASLQRALKLVDEDRLDEADIELGAYARIRREP